MSLLTCQMDAFRREGTFTVLACHPRGDGLFDVLLDDSVLYPEGGGQPADHGKLDGVPVLDVQRDPRGVLHRTQGPLPVGPVRAEVDWARRFDHMQQHTAQHLLTALALRAFGRRTVGFHLGERLSTIDLDGELSPDQQAELLESANQEIREDRPVRHRIAREDELPQVRSRGLPAGHSGPIRVVEIEGLDLNTCGGTHLRRLGEAQLVHLARHERYKGGCRLHVQAGGRALRALREGAERDRRLSELLSGPPERFEESLRRWKEDLHQQLRRAEALEAELGARLGAEAREAGEPVWIHRPGAAMSALLVIAEAAGPASRVLLTGGGEETIFLVSGEPGFVGRLGPEVAARLGGRGGGRPGRYQGKAARAPGWERRVEELGLRRLGPPSP